MLRLAVAVLIVALAGTANAGWRSMRIDGSSEASFAKSVAELQAKLSPPRRYVLDLALADIKLRYGASEYRRQLDGLGYDEAVKVTDPSGDTAKKRYQQASAAYRYGRTTSASSAPAYTPPRGFQQTKPNSWSEGRRGIDDTAPWNQPKQ